jgi:hypothetical protein
MCIEISWPEHNAREGVQGHHPVGHQGIQLQFIVQGNLSEKSIKAMVKEKIWAKKRPEKEELRIG